jgi:hypothetical protein
MLKTAAALLAFIVLFYCSVCVYLYVNQRAFLNFPTPQVDAAGAESIVLKSDGETLRIWRICACLWTTFMVASADRYAGRQAAYCLNSLLHPCQTKNSLISLSPYKRGLCKPI